MPARGNLRPLPTAGANCGAWGLAGKVDMVVANWNNLGTHVPISLAVSQRKKLDPDGWLWSSVLAITGQPCNLE